MWTWKVSLLYLNFSVLCTAYIHGVLHEKRDHIPQSWVKRGRMDASEKFFVQIGLAQRNLDLAEDYLLEISDPASSNYGKHWTTEKVNRMFQPSDEAVKSVKQWLFERGNVQSTQVVHSDNNAWLAFEAQVDVIENIFEAEFHYYEHESGHILPSCTHYHVAKEVQSHIDYILPGIFLPLYISRGVLKDGFKSKRGLKYRSPGEHTTISETAPAHCYETATPSCVSSLYNIQLNPKGPTSPKNKMGIFEDGSYYAQQDLDVYFSTFSSFIPNGTHPDLSSIDGGDPAVEQGRQATGEATLDIEMAYPLIHPQQIRLLQTNDRDYGKLQGPKSTIPDGFNNLLDALDRSYCNYSAYGETGNDPRIDPKYPDPAPGKGSYKGHLMCGTYKPPSVISISVAGQEADVPAAYQKRQCNEFMKLGLQGVSVIVPSGDTGVRAYPPAEGRYGCLGPDHNIFSPMWPSGCPYVTTVGATMIAPGNTVHDPEHVANIPGELSSGGGFSNLYPAPKYQIPTLKEYFSNHNPPFKFYSHIFQHTSEIRSGAPVASTGGVYNRIGRGIPDVAAIGFNLSITFMGYTSNFGGGSSASVPIFASMINRVNELRLAKGKSTLGFINPALYRNPNVLRDITIGFNTGCGIEGSDLPKAFSAVDGWDPATGLGSPDFEKLSSLLIGL